MQVQYKALHIYIACTIYLGSRDSELRSAKQLYELPKAPKTAQYSNMPIRYFFVEPVMASLPVCWWAQSGH